MNLESYSNSSNCYSQWVCENVAFQPFIYCTFVPAFFVPLKDFFLVAARPLGR